MSMQKKRDEGETTMMKSTKLLGKSFLGVIAVAGLLAAMWGCTPAPKDPPLVLKTQMDGVDLKTLSVPPESLAAQVGAPTLWQRSMKKGEIVVAVIGTGIDYTMSDIADSLWINKGEYGDNKESDRVDNDNNGYEDDLIGYDFVEDDPFPYDRNGLDTLTAGLIASRGKTDKRFTGINPNARIMALRYMNEDGVGKVEDLVLAMNYAVDNKADVIYIDCPKADLLKNNPHLFEITLERTVGAQIHVVIGAGNDRNMNVPKLIDLASKFENVVIVGASVKKGDKEEIAEFTNLGRERVDLLALGSDIEGLYPGGEKRVVSTTATSAALVAGALSLIKALDGVEPYRGAQALLYRNVKPNAVMQNVTLTGGTLNLNIGK